MSDLTRSAKVLIVDDEQDTVEVVERMLTDRGFEIARAYDGDQALEAAHRLKPDLIVLDVMMPEQDGWLVCAKLKAIQPAPKIIIFTVLKHGESDRMAQFVHADGIIHKPFTREQLLAKIDQTLANGYGTLPPNLTN
jgi:DNA-binding response OmpR family regulator